MTYLYVFLGAGLLSVLYLYGIRRGLGALDSLEAVAKARAEVHPKASAEETATNHPAPADAANLDKPPAGPPANPPPPPNPVLRHRPSGNIPAPPAPSRLLVYGVPTERHDEYLKLLKPPKEANKIRIGCLGRSERACVVAGQFLLLLSEAGWNIDENKVFRLDSPIPVDGVSIVTQPEPGPPQPPHLGRWHAMNLTETTLFLAFAEMGLKPNSSGDPTLVNTTTGVYFGPEPAELKIDKQLVLSLQISKFVLEENALGDPSTPKSSEEAEWAIMVANWLRINIGESKATQFSNIKDTGEQKKYLLSLVPELIKPKPQ